MLTGIDAHVLAGTTTVDHLIDSAAMAAVSDAVAGRKFSRSRHALNAARAAFLNECDPRVRLARITVRLRNAWGDEITITD